MRPKKEDNALGISISPEYISPSFKSFGSIHFLEFNKYLRIWNASFYCMSI